jgi:Cu(I)/Ag(I) efflux system membrane protein CusA/SilA
VFTLEAQEGRLFSPLAFTKTYAVAAAAVLSVTLVPVLMGVSGQGPDTRRGVETVEPVSHSRVPAGTRGRPSFPKATLMVAVALLAFTLVPITRLGSEFLPPLAEGDLLYMPSALPDFPHRKPRPCCSILIVSSRRYPR